MSTVGVVESLWRYPVKSMAGETVPEAFIGYAGVYGDRLYAFHNLTASAGFPYLTGREQREMLQYRPRFRHPDLAAKPLNHLEAEKLGPGLTPVYPDTAALMVDVQTPTGRLLAVDDPALGAMLIGNIADTKLSLLRSDRAMTDCRPVSLISLQTIQQIGEEVALTLDNRRFRANVYVRLDAAAGFAEDAFVGHRLQIGARVVLAVLDRDSRCKMIGIDPDTAQENPAIPRKVAHSHAGNAGVYCAVMTEGMVRSGDVVVLLD